MSKSRTLPSRQRTNVLKAYRSRGRANRNLWLVYSQKTNRDWVLRSDRHLVHWVLNLETDPDIQTFELEPSAPISSATNDASINMDALVVRSDGTREHHKLQLGRQQEPTQELSASPQGLSGSEDALPVRVFTETDLGSRGAEAMRWLKVVCYCAAIRDESQTEATLAAITVMRGKGQGTVLDILQNMSDFDREVSLGVICRLAISGDIALDLSASGFTTGSRWTRRVER
jgi:hypothetical protein